MKIKKTILILLIILVIFTTISTVNAVKNSTNDNLTTEIIKQDEINDNTTTLQSQSTENTTPLTQTQETIKKSDGIITYNAHDEYEHGTTKTVFDIDKNLKVKYKSNSKFGIYLLTVYGYDVDDEKIILKVWTGKKVKQYHLTVHDGYAEFNTKNLKVGTHKVKVIYKGNHYEYFGCKAYSKIIVKKDIVKKTKTHTSKSTTKKKKGSNWKSVTLKIKSPSSYYFACKKLKNGDKIETVYSLGGQYSKGVYAQIMDYDYPIHTKIKKVKFYFKKAGYVKTKTVKHIKNSKYSSIGKTSLISGYTPFKATVWYK